MITTIQTEADKIDNQFLEAIKTLFKNKRIKVTIEDEIDETEYLLNNESNKEFLLRSIKQAETATHISFNSVDELK
ncbi:hypothetical protein AEM51_01160 [Bacteroidetes bacterium UKL13-3]|jgi:hypothetical protein|nr:hypothetical protein AEM51_01160 [Bacteroidetes bacterium UKL13-3]HCP92684.1 hypothetical protein [Bacteroidota bacterium]